MHRPRNSHYQCVGYPVEDSEHKYKPVALLWQFDLRTGLIWILGRLRHRSAIAIQSHDVPDLDAIGAAAVDRDDRVRASFTYLAQALIDRHDAAPDENAGSVRRVIDRLRRPRRNKLVATPDFLRDLGKLNGAWLAGS